MNGSLIEQYRQIHATRIYGNTSVKNAPYLLPHIRSLRPTSAVDYGCGQSRLADVLRNAGVTRIARYDPAIDAYAARPMGFYDLLLSIDVLEHIPEDEIDAVLADMASLARQAIIVIDTGPAKMLLPDGSNAHATVRPHAWWAERLQPFFPYLEPIRVRSRRRAAFKTWPTPTRALPRMWFTFFAEERRYRMAKLGLARV